MRRLLFTTLTLLCLLFGATGDAHAEPLVAVAARLGNPQQFVFQFDSLQPQTFNTTQTITGLQQENEQIRDIDYRPSNGLLYAITTASRIYTIDPATGSATFVSAIGVPLSGNSINIDFNPVTGELRVVTSSRQNLRVNVDTGETIVDGTLSYAPGDPNFGLSPTIRGAAYTNNYEGATETTLYDIEGRGVSVLVTQNPPNDGVLNTVGSLWIAADRCLSERRV